MMARQSFPQKDAWCPMCNISRGTWRVEDYSSFMAIRATNGEIQKIFLSGYFRLIPTRAGPEHPGVEFSLTMFEDPGCQLPESITRCLDFNPEFIAGFSWVATQALPRNIFVFFVFCYLYFCLFVVLSYLDCLQLGSNASSAGLHHQHAVGLSQA